MRAHLGDELVVESLIIGSRRRDGVIVGLHHADGSPPYDVRWSDTGRVTLFSPGPDAHIHPLKPPEDPSEPGTEPQPPPPGSDFGRRVAHERQRLGLSRAEVADRAGVAESYLAYLEQQPADPASATVLSLAAALETTPDVLRGADAELAPGGGRAARHPRLRELEPEECLRLLSSHGVGRLALSTLEGPQIIPVNYALVDDTVVYRTAPGTVTAGAVGNLAAFQVDHIDEAMSRGWSVLVVGPARHVTGPAADELAARAPSLPWVGGDRPLWVAIKPLRISGRRIDVE
ncbi:pyridoxamine 5'-phosphate oxidase family protein [Streptomyces ochraceiscleroticus]|uniref:Pyridoxamine 5'-phosphate oxidase family protein n=1 Tax=Streptomyces ochraceiscleroticus TaxID=47761 RepID=A0ABW1MLJ2_9ACTN|nr:pyridoxamine 5'-phosphate oxidase family protein [Streptomyces ochraceiscleroticus]